MMEINRHLEILLLSHDCVIVPGLGGFMAHHQAARYDDRDQMFIPPLRTLGFNPQLSMSDPLLAQSFADALDISYPEAVVRLEQEVSEIKRVIESHGRYEFTDIGVLGRDDSGNYSFSPCEAGILSPAYYGLSTFEMPKLSISNYSQTSPTVVLPLHPAEPQDSQTSETMLNLDTPEAKEKIIKIKVSLLRNLAVAGIAAAALFFFARPVDTTMESEPQKAEMNTGLLNQIMPKDMTATPEFNSILDKVANLSDRLNHSGPVGVTPKSGCYTIVLAYRVPLENAKLFVKILHDNGIKGAQLIDYKNDNVVVYGSYSSQDEAYPVLKELIKNEYITDGWIMQVE